MCLEQAGGNAGLFVLRCSSAVDAGRHALFYGQVQIPFIHIFCRISGLSAIGRFEDEFS
ncbi:Uncharacterized protein ChrSV_3901 [Chromobacterium vaccinii]|nr:Uncharacterized protein ChrSW_3901 [Chromobacterium vaccinii]QND91358.1 Uncharacterized protein ChrSV_3901 [Chromobacterium vaccinii]